MCGGECQNIPSGQLPLRLVFMQNELLISTNVFIIVPTRNCVSMVCMNKQSVHDLSYCCAVNILCPKENICLCIKMQICLHCSPVRYALRKRVCCCRHLFLFFFSCECAESKVLWDCGGQRVLFVDSRRTDFVCVNCAATGPICRLILI